MPGIKITGLRVTQMIPGAIANYCLEMKESYGSALFEGGPFRQKNNIIHVPEGSALGATLNHDALNFRHQHLVNNGPFDHFHDPQPPGVFR